MGAITRRVSDRIAWIEVDVRDQPVNKISRDVREELREHLECICTDEDVVAAVLISRKADQFIAGADVEEFARLQTRAEALSLVREGQSLVNRFETVGKPIVAAINGACIGGGVEAVLACTYRIATEHSQTLLRLPEVRLGIIPAAGGCQRLPRLLGLRNALEMILTGRAVSARQAFQTGLIDDLVHPSILESTAAEAAMRLASGWRPRRRRQSMAKLIAATGQLVRKAVFSRARKNVLAKTHGNYPAPLAAIDAVDHGLKYGLEAGLEHEAAHFSELAVSAVSKNLVQLFFAGTAAKKDIGRGAASAPRYPIRNLAIVGSGFMGPAIAGVAAANARVDVRIQDKGLKQVAGGLDIARSIIARATGKGRMDEFEQRRRELLLSGGIDWAGFARADLVIEAVPDDLEVKREVVDEIESRAKSECVIASNTCTIPVAQIAATAHRPQRVIGMHFFAPVEKTPLVEVVRHDGAADWATFTAARFGQAMNKTVIVVKDAPGFWVNRILAPYLYEAWLMLEEGVPGDVLDSAMTEFGFAVGPVSLLDDIGLDIVRDSLRAMSHELDDRFVLEKGIGRMVEDGRLGRKVGRGLYRYIRGKRKGIDPTSMELIGARVADTPPSAEEIEKRLVSALLNEAVRAFAEGVVSSARDGDLGAIYGVGFPPFRGGPFRYLDQVGCAEVVARLEELVETHGSRFTPTARLTSMSERNEKFYSKQLTTEN